MKVERGFEDRLTDGQTLVIVELLRQLKIEESFDIFFSECQSF